MATKINFERQPDASDLGPHLRYSAGLGLPVAVKDSCKGQKAIICSTGSTIKHPDVLKKIKRYYKRGYKVFALKESIPFLKKKGIKVTYSCAMDPGGDRQVTRTPADPSVIYYIASSCNPKLFDHLLSAGCEVRIFHSACGHGEQSYQAGMFIQAGPNDFAIKRGEFVLKTLEGENEFCPLVPLIKTEINIYNELFGYADTMCGGFTVTNRCLALAVYLGFDLPIILAGTDFGWRNEGGSHYSDLVKVAPSDKSYFTDSGKIDGKEWFTKPDQLASAVDVALKAKKGEVRILGDSLAAALQKKDEDFLDKLVKFTKT